jgi:uncharacterized membrane protein
MANVATFLHLTGAIGFFAGVALAGFASRAARGRSDARDIAALLALSRTGVIVVALSTPVPGIFGLWLVHLGHFGYSSAWVQISVGLFLLALAVGGLGGARPKQARLHAQQLATQCLPVDEQLRALLNDRRSLLANYGSLALMIAIVADMVFKP